MIKLKKIINDLLSENLQLAEKLYFKTGILDENDKKYILDITHGDYTTKYMCDLYISLHKSDFYTKQLEKTHEQLLQYNKNVLPIKNFDINNKHNNASLFTLQSRQDCLDYLKKMPRVAIRNLKKEITTERDGFEFDKLKNTLDYIILNISLISNRDDKVKNKIYDKIFKSNSSLKDISHFLDDKSNLIGGKKITRNDIENILKKDSYNLKKVFDSNNCMVIAVFSQEGIKHIGCNSLWCFTYGDHGYRMWADYSFNDMVYVIIDLNENSDSKYFMYTLIRPLESRKFYRNEDESDQSPLFDMSNENYNDPYDVLDTLVGARNIKKLFTFND